MPGSGDYPRLLRPMGICICQAEWPHGRFAGLPSAKPHATLCSLHMTRASPVTAHTPQEQTWPPRFPARVSHHPRQMSLTCRSARALVQRRPELAPRAATAARPAGAAEAAAAAAAPVRAPLLRVLYLRQAPLQPSPQRRSRARRLGPVRPPHPAQPRTRCPPRRAPRPARRLSPPRRCRPCRSRSLQRGGTGQSPPSVAPRLRAMHACSTSQDASRHCTGYRLM